MKTEAMGVEPRFAYDIAGTQPRFDPDFSYACFALAAYRTRDNTCH